MEGFFRPHTVKTTDAVEELHARYKTLQKQWATNMDLAEEHRVAMEEAHAAADQVAYLANSYHEALEKIAGREFNDQPPIPRTKEERAALRAELAS